MSSVKANNYYDTSGGSNAQLYGVSMRTGGTAFVNRIINGDMRIDQRNAGASVTPTSGGYSVDRWQYAISQASKLSFQQNAGSVTPPTGFTNYLGMTSQSAYSITTTDFFLINQPIEGLNIADLAWGTANAATVTLSFRVYSSLTGTFGGALGNSAGNRSYPFSYTIGSANTWTTITITISGDTSGTWLTTNGIGMRVWFGLGVGSTYSGTAGSWSGSTYYSATSATSIVGTNGATFYITGVQLEAGSVASPFERVDYGRQLIMCQRYFVGGGQATIFTVGWDGNYSLNSGGVSWDYQMRTTPTISITAGGMDGHHTTPPTVRQGPVYYGVGLQFTGAASRTSVTCNASVTFNLSAEL